MNKKIFGLFVFLFILFTPSLSNGQELPPVPNFAPLVSTPANTPTLDLANVKLPPIQMPSGLSDAEKALFEASIKSKTNTAPLQLAPGTPILVRDIAFKKEVYTAGDTVTGTVLLENRTDLNQTDVYFDISLVGEYSTEQGRYNLPGKTYDTKSFGPFSAKAGSVTNVPFSYDMPKGIGGKGLGIEVRARSASGVPYGWKEKLLQEVLGGKSPVLTLKDAYVYIDGKTNAVGVGPTIRATSTINFRLIASNISKEAVKATPSVEIYERQSSGKLVKKYNEKSVEIAVKKDLEIVINPYMNDRIPGVYVAKVSLVDAEGQRLIEPVEYRYILPGATAVIHNAVFDQQSVNKKETVNVGVSFSGPPVDITTGEREKIQDGSLTVKILDSKSGLVLGEETISIDLNVDVSNQNVPIEVNAIADSIKAEVTISGNDKVLATYSSSPTTLDLKKIEEIRKANESFRNLVILAVALALVIVTLFLTVHKRSPRRSLVILITILLTILAAILVHRYAAASINVRVAPYSYRSDFGPGRTLVAQYLINTTMNIELAGPAKYYYLSGETIDVSGSAYSYSCLNTPEHVEIKATLYSAATGGPVSSTYFYNNSTNNCAPGCGSMGGNTWSYSFGIPQALPAGDYFVYLESRDYWGGNPSWETYSYNPYYQHIKIVSPPTLSCSPDRSTAIPGEAMNWTIAPSGGSGANRYFFSGTDYPYTESAYYLTPTYSTPGVKTMSALVYDLHTGRHSGWVQCSGSVTVASPVPAPEVTGPSSGIINTYYTFYAVSRLPAQQTGSASDALLSLDTPQLRYGFDWDKNGTVDTWQPNTGYENIGVMVNEINAWGAVGQYTFQVKAEDSKGVSSSWTPFTINITDPTTCLDGSLPVNGLCGNAPETCLDGSLPVNGSCGGGGGGGDSGGGNRGGGGALCPNGSSPVNGSCGSGSCPPGTSGPSCLPPGSPSIISFTATPNTVKKNRPCTLNLVAQGVKTCSITNTNNAPISVNANGYASTTITTPNITETTRFTATCNNADLTIPPVSKNVTCFLNPSPIEQ